jgi:pilus assembly protein CpaC
MGKGGWGLRLVISRLWKCAWICVSIVFWTSEGAFGQAGSEPSVGEETGGTSLTVAEESDIPVLDLTPYADPSKKKDQPKIGEHELILTVGEAKAVQVPYNISRHTLVHTGLIKLKINSDLTDPEGNPVSEILMQAEKTGSTELRVYDDRRFLRGVFKLSVSAHNIRQIVTEVETLLNTVEGLQIKVIGERIFLDGEILIPRDIARIQLVLQQYPMIINLTRLSPNTQNLYAARMEADIGKPEVRVRANQGKFIFEGVAESSAEAEAIIKIAETYIPGVYQPATGVKEAQTPTIVNMLAVRPKQSPLPEKIIKVVMQYVELTRGFSRSFNFNWSPSIDDNSNISFDFKSGLTGAITGTIDNLFPKLSKAVSLNHARIMNTATLLIKENSSTPSTLTTGIDIPYTSGQTQSGSPITAFKPVESVTSLTGKLIPGTDQIQLGVSIGIQELISASGSASSTNKIQTEIILGKNQSAAVGGFFKESMQRDFGKTPPAKTGTNIFSMGRSKNYGHNKSQFIVFITPEIISGPHDIAEASREFKQKFRLIRDI